MTHLQEDDSPKGGCLTYRYVPNMQVHDSPEGTWLTCRRMAHLHSPAVCNTPKIPKSYIWGGGSRGLEFRGAACWLNTSGPQNRNPHHRISLAYNPWTQSPSYPSKLYPIRNDDMRQIWKTLRKLEFPEMVQNLTKSCGYYRGRLHGCYTGIANVKGVCNKKRGKKKGSQVSHT